MRTTTDPSVRSSADEQDSAVEMQGISKAFHGVPVLRDVDFDLKRGEVHALVGENGAGKSTLMKILQGVHTPDSGELRIDGQPVRFQGSDDARAAGIGMVFQEFSLIPTLSVAENVFLAREPRLPSGLLDDGESVRRSRAIFDEMGVALDARARLGTLTTASWQLTEIAKTLAQKAACSSWTSPLRASRNTRRTRSSS